MRNCMEPRPTMRAMTVAAPSRSNRHANSPAPEADHASTAQRPSTETEAAAEARRNAHYSRASTSREGDGACHAPPLTSMAPSESGAAAAPKRSLSELGTDILSIRADLKRPMPESERTAKEARLRALSSDWCALARAAGMKPPGDCFDPFRASNRELAEAIAWTELGNTYPVRSLADGGALYREQLALAHLVRSPALFPEATTAFAREPGKLMSALYKELHRLGDETPCTTTDTVESLLARRSRLVRMEGNRAAAEAAEEERRRPTLGLDGRIGSAESVARYELEQQIAAVNPGTTLGSILASQYAGDIEAMRHAGEFGNAFTEMFHGAREPRHAPRVRPRNGR
jgi:hypothetical protein